VEIRNLTDAVPDHLSVECRKFGNGESGIGGMLVIDWESVAMTGRLSQKPVRRYTNRKTTGFLERITASRLAELLFCLLFREDPRYFVWRPA
jgi:hypothetical protein